jgi:hypothetical protein
VFEWEQTAPFALSEANDIDPYLATLNESLADFSPEDKTRIKNKIKELYIEEIKTHTPMRMSNKLYIVRKSK